MHIVFIAIGSNLEDKAENCLKSIKEIASFAKIVQVSSLYETDPVGKEDQPNFINCAIEIKTDLSPHNLLSRLQTIENKLGRVRKEKWGPRTIDLDIIFYDNLVCTDNDLTIPHPRAHERRFVLEPISEIAPAFIHPGLEKSVQGILTKLVDNKRVTKLDKSFTTSQQ